MSYLTLIILTLGIGLIASWWCNHALKKYQNVPTESGITGAQAAQQMLAYYGIYNVPVHQGAEGQDFFDPRSNSVTLSPSAYHGRSVTALATACHEVGHACQYAQDYTPMKVRGALVPAVNLASNAWMIVFFAGIFLNLAGLVDLAILLYAVAVLFHVVTLPVEFNASSRALKYMQTVGVSTGEIAGSNAVLRACAFTYVAAALTSLLQLLYLLAARED
ncbi:MAG: zinc metallopeptidase [Coriobacteriia bacterium]|nr:zinc metallopeptidase [Coriobacteriia bacterium]